MTTPLLDPLSLPLQGSRLIEASAGTGKTWTIAALYLRLVLGHGANGAAFSRALMPENILVMTFTRAATRELTDRIRRRLVEAARCFQGEAQPKADDEYLQRLLADYPPGSTREAAAWRLSVAAQGMDDAAVFTIDAWCQRMLREHAFDSGHAFDEDLVADENALIQQAVHDYWRQQVYPLAGEALDGVLEVWPDVEAVIAKVQAARRMRQRAAPEEAPRQAPADESLLALWQRVASQRQAKASELKSQWKPRILEMRDWLCTLLQHPDNPLSKTKYPAAKVCGWFETLEGWVNDPALAQPKLKEDVWLKLTPEALRAGCNKGKTIDVPEVFGPIETLSDALAELPDLAAAMQDHAAAQVETRLRALKAASGQFSFQDQIERLDAALAGPRAERLRTSILQQYPVALIDEFQDTSALQFRLFDRLYGLRGTPAADSAVLLIGDPKQSIYAFRGADIDSYLQARLATQGRHVALATNHRSTEAVVRCINRLFGRREQAAGEGAFLYRRADDSEDANPLPFIAVAAKGRPERLVCAEGAVPALTCAVHAETESKNAARERFAAHAAARIVALLEDAQAGFEQADGGFVRLRPSDIAVLVRDGSEAQAVRDELKGRGVSSVYLSDRDSVFASPEAADLLRWLRAVAAPRDGRLARAAFATRTLGALLPEMAALATDDAVFEDRLELLAELHGIWLRQGVLPMVRRMLHRLDLPANWLNEADGERRLTNVLHLAELLQTASSTLDGEQALIQWLQQQMTEEGNEEQVVRLESEADLVRVVTIHKSKGLEYPVVFLPFATAFKEPRDGTEDRDRLREDLRLLYVALTRARHALWVGLGALKIGNAKACVLHRSAIGYLLGGETPFEGQALGDLLSDTFGNDSAVHIVDAAASPEFRRLQRASETAALVEPLVYHATFERDWSIGSFSALVRDLTPRSTQQTAVPVMLQDELWTAQPLTQPVSVSAAARHRFPRGALMGQFVHEQLAWLGENGFDLASPEMRQRLLQRCAGQGWDEARANDLLQWLSEILATRLPPLGVALPEIGAALAEMEFWLPVTRARAAEIDALCQRHILPGRARPALTERVLHGMVMGFADLVFAHGGRYWVLDYKSNALGADDADYTKDALEAAVLDHRYDVQSALYMLALHRLLRARLRSDYDPETHLGGGLVLFLRGIGGPVSGCVHLAPDAALLEGLDAIFARQGETA
ncbi:MAG: exodeoxyribonuclease V subunit beta [Pseudomonadota bacterium]